MMRVRIIWLVIFLFATLAWQSSSGKTDKYRLMWRNNPATTMVIGWNQASGSNPVVYYDTIDHGTNYTQYQYQTSPARQVNAKGMDNRFARLSGLQPDTKYYFVIRDSEGNSDRYWFETIPANPNKALSIVAGGDSRNNRTPRKNANKIVRKLKPHFVIFSGDFTAFSFNFQWKNWFDDWQESITQGGRLTPIVPARGNHEYSGNELTNLFDVPHSDQYYALTFGGSLLRLYTLNTEIAITGNQANWLANDLNAYHDSVAWKFAQYHKPMRPHVSSKSEQQAIRNSWGQMFYDYGVNLVLECDAHSVKTTWPIKPSYANGHDEGFVRDKSGTVYVGEGCWGAPLRNNDDDKSWTRNSGSFNQVKWIWVNRDTVKMRTIKTDNADNVLSLSDSTRFQIPQFLDIWNPSHGKVVSIANPALYPEVAIQHPLDSSIYQNVNGAQIRATASDQNTSISEVSFFVDGHLIATDQTRPYTAYWPFNEKGSHTLTAKATNAQGYTRTSEPVLIGVSYLNTQHIVSNGDDDAEEGSNNLVDLGSNDLELTEDNGDEQTVGIRFAEVKLPEAARITTATLRFTVDETSKRQTSLNIKGETSNKASAYQDGILNLQNISARSVTNSSVIWHPSSWDSVGTVKSTPDISNILRKIRNQSGWQSGNAMAFVIDGSGKRVAKSYNGAPDKAPVLRIMYDYGPMPMPDLGSDRQICAGDTVHLSPGTGYSYYGWNDGQATGHPLIADTSGQYIANVRGGPNNLTYAEDTVHVSVQPLPKPSLGNDTSIRYGDSLLLHAQSGFSSYSWNGPAGEAVDDSTWQATEPGTYSLEVTDHNGCPGRDTIVVDSFRVSNDSSIVDPSDTTTTVSRHSKGVKHIKLTNKPNPFSGQTEVIYSLPREMNAEIAVMDISGRKVATLHTGPASKGKHKISFNPAQLGDGIYFLYLKAQEYSKYHKMVLTD